MKRRLLPLAAVLLALAGALGEAAPPPAAPFASLTADLDGDGRPDQIVATRAGTLIATNTSGMPLGSITPRTVPGDIRSVELTTHATSSGRPLLSILIVRRAEPASEQIVAQVAATELTTLWDGEVGPIDEEGTVFRGVRFEGDGFAVSESAADTDRCDGAPVPIFVRRFDPVSGTLQPAPPPIPDFSRVPAVTARPDNSAVPGYGVFRFEAASTVAGDDGSAAGLTPPSTLDDDDPTTPWIGAGPDGGRGAFVTARTRLPPMEVTGIALWLAPSASPDLGYSALRRPREIGVMVPSGPLFRIEVPPDAPPERPLLAALPATVTTSCLSLTILDSAGATGAPTALGEAQIRTRLAGSEGIEALVRSLLTTGPAADAAEAALERAGAPAAQALATSLPSLPPQARRRAIDALASLALPAGVPALVDLLRAPHLQTAEEAAVGRALLRTPRESVAALAGLLDDPSAPAAARATAARLLGALGGSSGTMALVAALGAGPDPLRQALRQALIHENQDLTSVLLAELDPARATTDPRLADAAAVLAAGAVRATPAERALALRLLPAIALAPQHTFEARARAVSAFCSFLGRRPVDSNSQAAFAALLDPSRTPDPVLRRLAAGSIDSESDASLATALLRATMDPDPGVRQAAAGSLAGRSDPGDVAALGRLLASDGWILVRRAAVEALAVRCERERRDLLAQAVQDPAPDVGLAALESLARCRDSRAIAPLLAIATGRTVPVSFRERSAAALARAEDPSTAAPLAEALAQVRSDALLGDEERIRVAMAIADALGHSHSPRAREPLVAALDDPALPPLHLVAAMSLAALCPSLDVDDRTATSRALSNALRENDGATVAAVRAAAQACGR